MSRIFVELPKQLYPKEFTNAYAGFADRTVEIVGSDVIVDYGVAGVQRDTRENISEVRENVDKYTKVLTQLVFAAFVDNFQSYLIDLLLLIHDHRPEILSGGITKNAVIFDQPDLDSLKRHIIGRHVIDLGYKRIDELDEYFRDRLKFQLTTSKFQSLRLTRIVQLRNVIAHNRGKVSSVFLARAGAKVDQLGEDVGIPNIYAVHCFLGRIADRIDHDAAVKFKLPTSKIAELAA